MSVRQLNCERTINTPLRSDHLLLNINVGDFETGFNINLNDFHIYSSLSLAFFGF